MRSFHVRRFAPFLALALGIVSAAFAEDPLKTSVCQIQSDRAAFNHKLVELTGFVVRGFENFTLVDPQCESWQEIWVEYGGTVGSGVAGCCGISSDRHRSKPLTVEGLALPFTEDKPFHDFDRLLERQPEAIVHATLVGRYFAGKSDQNPALRALPGFGHAGCCSLFVVQQVLSVDPETRADLDYGTEPEHPNSARSGCSYSILLRGSGPDLIAQQAEADSGARAWAFDDPLRVAAATLTSVLKLEPATQLAMSQTKKSASRIAYEWKPGGKKESFQVVVNRPYWLSLYAKNAAHVVWAPMVAYKLSCQ